MSLRTGTGETQVTVAESGGILTLLAVTIRGTSISDIPITISPLTYEQFATEFTASLLDILYPARPTSAAMGKAFNNILYHNTVLLFCKQMETSIPLTSH